MAINPILMNATITSSQNVLNARASEDSQASVIHGNTEQRLEKETREKLSRVREGENAEKPSTDADAREKGKNEYTGDGGARRKKKEDGVFFAKHKVGFDITV